MPGAHNVVPVSKEANGPFRMWRKLSSGGFATAMAAEDLASSRLICLKVFTKTQLKQGGTEESILKEIEVYKRLASSKENYPGDIFLMQLDRSFQTRKLICFAMDLMLWDLSYCMDNESAYCGENARRWSAQLAIGINALHRMGIIHRDIKPGNILIDIQENVKIADFGLSFMKKEPKRLHKNWGYSYEVSGTIKFMAPEILRNMDEPYSETHGAPVDWWAFGCVLYELLSPPEHKTLFNSEDDIKAYVAWNKENLGKLGLYPAFLQLGEIKADLVKNLVDVVAPARYRFKDIAKHEYFSNGDGTTEFGHACSRAAQREEQSDLLPSFRDEQTEKVTIWRPLPPGRPEHIAEMDWERPRP
ncbi:hypothetical protein CY34DRAFT_205396 [Suillus luteus UH-Slu-Lm8-n1]|uniref:non-specific serine/threonine protein kinase n=1 Tax=Suillus luteus UH-Slu-Lm8-n1 TaxID=930992 RepID=A0A0D0AHV2_9AGAM|nr:hypothetical protein CY34DRAFT_205396 [Suillus luteus UH-Slu-Lm8-n1]